MSPFTNPAESEYDAFIAGHASNSISAALGIDIANGRKSKVESQKNTVAIIGDGAMTGGLAFEGLNNTSMDKNNLLIVLNDNHMAIDPLKGGFTQYLVDITTSATYNKWRWKLYRAGVKLHLIDEAKKARILRRNNTVKAALSNQKSNIFTGLNIRYFGPTDGHDVESLVRILSEIKNHKGPKVLHIITKKGKGYAPAENDQTVWHAPGEFDVNSGERLTVSGERTPLWQGTIQWGNDVFAAANFDPKETLSINVPSGTWYDYLNGGSKAGSSYSLKPGELKVFTGSPVQAPTFTDIEKRDPQGVEEVENGKWKMGNGQKFLKDGQIFIRRGDKTYTVTGLEVR